jgi:hypothetical protein
VKKKKKKKKTFARKGSIYLDALEGHLDGRKCDAPTLTDVHVWLLLFADDLVLISESEVGLQQQLDTLQQFYSERGKNKSNGV